LTIKRHLKNGIRIFLENDADVYKIVIRLSKSQILRIIDVILPDDVEIETPK
jgi:hypothetical protein